MSLFRNYYLHKWCIYEQVVYSFMCVSCVCCSSALFHNSYLNKWCIPFPGADRSIVHRSEYIKWQNRKQRPVSVLIRFHCNVSLSVQVERSWLERDRLQNDGCFESPSGTLNVNSVSQSVAVVLPAVSHLVDLVDCMSQAETISFFPSHLISSCLI